MAFLDDQYTTWLFYLIFALLIILGRLLRRVFELRQQMSQYLTSMNDEMNELIVEHQKELDLEKKKSSSHYMKMISYRRDCNSKVGGLERKLREKHEVVRQLSQKVEAMEWTEEEANEMTEELIAARSEMFRKEALIARLTEQLATSQRIHVESEAKYQKRVRELEQRLIPHNKENQWK